MAWKIKFLEYSSTKIAGFGTDEDSIYIDSHGVEDYDMIVNTDRRNSPHMGSSMVATNDVDSFYLLGGTITDQAFGDSIRIYKYVDRTNYVKIGSLEIQKKIAGQSSCKLSILTEFGDFIPFSGQRLQILDGETVVFKGVVTVIDSFVPDYGLQTIQMDLQIDNLTQIATRRTIGINYDIGTAYTQIAVDMIEILYSEGISLGVSIDEGSALLDDDWQDDCISVSDILDRCAQSSAWQWFIDDLGGFWFIDEMDVVNCTTAIVDDTWTQIWNMRCTETIDTYSNKVFFTGGSDGSGNPVIISAENTTEIQAMQNKAAGTGVYGSVIRDSSISESQYEVAESRVDPDYTTKSSQITITDHGQLEGNVIWNLTRSAYATISGIYNTNMFYITPSITGQVPTDVIVFFNVASEIIKNALKKQSTIVRTVSFETNLLTFNPGEKLHIDLEIMNLIDGYWLIESVRLTDNQQTSGLRCEVVAVERRNSAFSTQRNVNYRDYYINN